LHGTGWRADDRQGNGAGARELTGFYFFWRRVLMERWRAKVKVSSFVITNSRPHTMKFWLEPWAEEFEVPSGSKIKIICRSPAEGDINHELDITPELFTFYAPPGSLARVYINNEDVTSPASDTLPSPF
jgi:hypothetical protein